MTVDHDPPPPSPPDVDTIFQPGSLKVSADFFNTLIVQTIRPDLKHGWLHSNLAQGQAAGGLWGLAGVEPPFLLKAL